MGRKKHQLSEKSRIIEQAALTERQTEDQIILDVNTRFRKLQEAKQLLAVAGLSRELAQEKLRVTTNRYKQEVALIKDVLQQQATLAEANHQYTRVWPLSGSQMPTWKRHWENRDEANRRSVSRNPGSLADGVQ